MLVLGEGLNQELHDATITAEARYSINFINPKKMFCLGLHHYGSSSFLNVHDLKLYQFKAKDSEIFQKVLQLIK